MRLETVDSRVGRDDQKYQRTGEWSVVVEKDHNGTQVSNGKLTLTAPSLKMHLPPQARARS